MVVNILDSCKEISVIILVPSSLFMGFSFSCDFQLDCNRIYHVMNKHILRVNIIKIHASVLQKTHGVVEKLSTCFVLLEGLAWALFWVTANPRDNIDLIHQRRMKEVTRFT